MARAPIICLYCEKPFVQNGGSPGTRLHCSRACQLANKPAVSPKGFLRFVDVDGVTGCWNWQQTIDDQGYGRVTVRPGKTKKAHRIAYEHFVGPIPQGLVIDHICRNRACANPSHMELVTSAENSSRGVYKNRLKLTCPQGHPYSGDNLYVLPSGRHRVCRTCVKAAKRRYEERQRAAAA